MCFYQLLRRQTLYILFISQSLYLQSIPSRNGLLLFAVCTGFTVEQLPEFYANFDLDEEGMDDEVCERPLFSTRRVGVSRRILGVIMWIVYNISSLALSWINLPFSASSHSSRIASIALREGRIAAEWYCRKFFLKIVPRNSKKNGELPGDSRSHALSNTRVPWYTSDSIDVGSLINNVFSQTQRILAFLKSSVAELRHAGAKAVETFTASRAADTINRSGGGDN